ncbi:hypothetical protein [Blastococcus sp. VKM Ac-2987]|uniref:hypothetical protein n=1 Tax=Blastococcus sp. VKM Ac-2987 TaxID=3004141 RepID=UPI0022AB76B2|nr:hypothetical protein [Blastococcus sp. VKM Ac-2987]MCZ2860148.1 hypothetical protein [Blastococcus sp. VKM Ac-2987]
MTASATTPPPTVHRRVPMPDRWTTAGAGVALVCTLVGQYAETPWKSGSGDWGIDFAGNGGWAALASIAAFVAVAVVLVGLATDRARAVPPERTARRALVLAVLGVVTLAVFWTGVPPVLAGGAAGLALDSRRRAGRLPTAAAAGGALAVLVVATALWLAFTG